jgi:hypothetical protein
VHSRGDKLNREPLGGKGSIYLGEIMEKEFGIDSGIKKTVVFSIIISIILGGSSIILGIICFAALLLIQPLGASYKIISLLLIIYIPMSFLIGILQLVLGLINYITIGRVKIFTNTSGLIFISPGIKISSTWSNIKSIGMHSVYFGLKRYECLILDKPANQETQWWFNILKRIPVYEIPLSMFGDWRKSELGKEIQKYSQNII